MKREELFEGAIVLAKSCVYDRRSRWKVLEVRDTIVKVKKDNISMYTGFKHLRPASITPKALMELGFEKKQTPCIMYGKRESDKGASFCYQYVHKGPEDVRIALKGECKLWHQNVVFYDLCNISKVEKVSYIHEVQKILSNQQS